MFGVQRERILDTFAAFNRYVCDMPESDRVAVTAALRSGRRDAAAQTAVHRPAAGRGAQPHYRPPAPEALAPRARPSLEPGPRALATGLADNPEADHPDASGSAARFPAGTHRRTASAGGGLSVPLHGRRRLRTVCSNPNRSASTSGSGNGTWLASWTRVQGTLPKRTRRRRARGPRQPVRVERRELDGCRALPDQVGYGRRPGRKPRRERAHGQRLETASRVSPGAAASAGAAHADQPRHPPRRACRSGDIYGLVRCSRRLRSGHLGLVAAVGGLWASATGDWMTGGVLHGGRARLPAPGQARPLRPRHRLDPRAARPPRPA